MCDWDGEDAKVISLDQIDLWLLAREDERIEFKEARDTFSIDELTRTIWPAADSSSAPGKEPT